MQKQTLYKLTNQTGTTHGGYPYVAKKTHRLPTCAAPRLCSSNVLHAYVDRNLALLLNPIHANITNPRLWKIVGDVVVSDWGKVGSFEQEIVRELPLPKWYVDTKTRNLVVARFAYLCVKEIGVDKKILSLLKKATSALKKEEWATVWAAAAVRAAAAAATAALQAAAAASRAATAALQAAAYAAEAAQAAAAAEAARAARAAAAASRAAAKEINFPKLCTQAIRYATR